MAQTTVISAPMAVRAAGVYPLAAVNVGKQTSYLHAIIDRSLFGPVTSDADTVGQLIMEGSDDNGATWTILGGPIARGGVSFDRQGNVSTQDEYRIGPFANPKGASYRVRGTATLFQQLEVALTVTAE